MAVTPDKRALREAAAIIERAVDAYGAGDLAGSTRLFEEALQVMPDHARAQLYLGWVRELSSGLKKLDGLDEETLQAITDTLATDEEQTQEKRAVDAPVEESPWDPVPLTPSARQAAQRVTLSGLPVEATPAAPVSSAPPIEPAQPPPRERKPTPAQVRGSRNQKTPSGSTLRGVAATEPQALVPPRPKDLFDSTEGTGSKTREWSTRPTASNLPPLDVPELSDEQIQELLALDGSPMALELGGSSTQAPRLESLTDLGLGPGTDDRPIEIEIEAEPTPVPHVHPMSPTHIPLITSGDGDATEPRGQRRRDATTPDADLPPMAFQPGPEFDHNEQTPTRERRDVLRAVIEADAHADDDLHLPPLETSPVRDEIAGEGTNPTNPFIKRKLAEYSNPTGQLPKVDDLPPGPRPNDTNRQQVPDTLSEIQDPLDRGDVATALEAAEKFIASQDGMTAEAVEPHRWLLERVYETSLGSLQKVPHHGQAVADLEPRQAFLLSRLDGMSTIEDLLDVSGMGRLEALRVLALLVKRGVVTLK